MTNATSFIVDAKTKKTIERLRDSLNTPSNAEVIRRALILLVLASRTEADGGKVILQEKNGNQRQVVMG
jgi:hypothetical protein